MPGFIYAAFLRAFGFLLAANGIIFDQGYGKKNWE